MPDKLLSNANNKLAGINVYPEKPVTETLTNGFFTVDEKWTVKYWNKAAEKILGVSAKDIMGKNLWEEFAGIIPVEFYAIDQNTFRQNIPLHFEEYWGQMGAWFDVITYHCDDTLSVSFKSSTQYHSELADSPVQKLKILTELYKYVTEITNDCLWELYLQGEEIFWIDGGHKRTFGYQVENALIPQTFWEECIHPDDRIRVLTRLSHMITAKAEQWEDKYRFKKADGSYAYVRDIGHILYDADKRPSRIIGATQDITNNVLLENELAQERNTKQRDITDAILTAQENERAYIGNEMYDNFNQLLVVAKWNIQMAKKDGASREMCLEKASTLITQVIDNMRLISRKLVVPDMHVVGLFDNIKALLNEIASVLPVKVEFRHEGIDEEEDLDEKMQLDIFRIVQEQLKNIAAHSKATRVYIHLKKEYKEITLLISDNGEGWDISDLNKGLGIKNIKSRAELYDGTVEVISSPGKGFELKVVLKLTGVDINDILD